MNDKLLRFPHKLIRAEIIKKYMQAAGYRKAICFSCGNAAKYLIDSGIETLHFGVAGDLMPQRWFSQSDINKWFGDYFDATSGHLPVSLMQTLGEEYKKFLDELPDVTYVPTGSGETIICLKMAMPEKKFVAVYDIDKATEYNENAPLNKLVELLADEIIFTKGILKG